MTARKTKKKAGRKPRKKPVKPEHIEPRYPWEQQPDESPQAFQAFEHYLKDGALNRSIRKSARALGNQYSIMFDWSSKNDWVARCEAHDRHEARRKEAKWEEARDRMYERHADSAMAAIGAAMTSLARYIPTKENPEPPKMKERDAIRLLDIATRLERVSRGEPDTIQKTTGELKVTTPVDEKRASLVKVMENPEGLEAMAKISRLMGTDDTTGK